MPTQSQQKPIKISLSEYFDREYIAETRHEYHDGIVVEMAYASDNHELIVANLVRLLGNCVLGTNCLVYPSNRMIYVPECNKVFYADASIFCEKRETYQYSQNMVALLNPSVLIEVLSPSTERDDKDKKWRCYKKIKSLKQYVLIAQDEMYIKSLHKTDNEDEWLQIERDSKNEKIKIGDCEIALKDLYLNTELPSGEAQSD
jgi:Uma2 family endonuclease